MACSSKRDLPGAPELYQLSGRSRTGIASGEGSALEKVTSECKQGILGIEPSCDVVAHFPSGCPDALVDILDRLLHFR